MVNGWWLSEGWKEKGGGGGKAGRAQCHFWLSSMRTKANDWKTFNPSFNFENYFFFRRILMPRQRVFILNFCRLHSYTYFIVKYLKGLGFSRIFFNGIIVYKCVVGGGRGQYSKIWSQSFKYHALHCVGLTIVKITNGKVPQRPKNVIGFH